jgi:metallo-beta-lactamase class B
MGTHMKRFVALVGTLCAIVTGVMRAQGPPAPPPKPDTPDVLTHVAAAEKAAGREWQAEAAFFCSPTPNRANRPDDPLLEPTRLFDNLYVIGRAGTAVFAITTSDGIVLIDSGYADQLDSVLLPGLKALGLDESTVKYILLGHGHGDHYGGASYFQQKYGTKVALSAADWELLENPPAPRGGGGQARGPAPAPVPVPKRDIVLADGQVFTVGGQKFTVVAIPGHTPGSIGFVFPVKDGRENHVAALFGGTILIPGRITDASLQEYLRSIAHFADVAKRMNADVEIQNHPLYDNIAEKVAGVRAGKKGAANPFIVGRDAYQRFLIVQSECMKAQIARRAIP